MAKNVENCDNCKFFKQDVPGWSPSGYCVRYPPVPIVLGDMVAYVPQVDHEHWCGEWKPITTSQEIPASAVDPEELC